MFLIVAGIVVLAAAFAVRVMSFGKVIDQSYSWVKTLVFIAGLCLSFLIFLSTSFVYVPAHKVGLMTKVYGWKALGAGKIIATDGEKGMQAEILTTGTKFSLFINVLNSVELVDTKVVPEGYYGQIVAKDGRPLPNGAFIAAGYPDDKIGDMLDAKKFLDNGGYRGPQETVLKPGEWAINTNLFNVKVDDSTKAVVVPAGFLGIVKSNIATLPAEQCQEEKAVADATVTDALSVTLVPKGCVGLWKEPLLAGAYYMNRSAYDVTMFDARIETLTYKGGFTKRVANLSINQDGQITTAIDEQPQDVPKDAADRAIFAKIEGWDVPIEFRALVQIDDKTAPIVVGSVGSMNEVRDRIFTPTMRSVVRNILGNSIRVPKRDDQGNILQPVTYEVRPTHVLDLIDNREAIEAMIGDEMRREGRKAGLIVKEVRIGEPAIPPELLIPRLRQQLADQMGQTFARETESQNQRIKTEQARATADQQGELVKAQIAVQVASQNEIERETLGRGERKYLENLSQGQKQQALVLGEDRVAMLQGLDKVLAALTAHPELVGMINKLVPNIMVTGSDGGGLSGAAAILGDAYKRAQGPVPAIGAATVQ